MFALVASFAYQATAQDAEIILSQNTDETFIPGGVSCGGSDNWWLREYDLTGEGITTDVMLTGLEFGVEAADFDQELEFYAFDYVGFPTGFDITNPPAAVASGFITVGPGDVGTKIRATFDTPAQVAATATIVVAVVQPGASGNFLFLAVTAADTKESYLASEGCAITEPQTVTAIGFPGAKHLINLVVDDALTVGESLADKVSVYPNPATTVLNINLPSNVEVKSSSLTDMLGRTTGVVYSNGEMNIAGLSQGVYFLKLDTNFGTYTQKIVKQ